MARVAETIRDTLQSKCWKITPAPRWAKTVPGLSKFETRGKDCMCTQRPRPGPEQRLLSRWIIEFPRCWAGGDWRQIKIIRIRHDSKRQEKFCEVSQISAQFSLWLICPRGCFVDFSRLIFTVCISWSALGDDSDSADVITGHLITAGLSLTLLSPGQGGQTQQMSQPGHHPHLGHSGHCLMVTVSMSQLILATAPHTMGLSPPASHSSLAPASPGTASSGPGPGLSPLRARPEARLTSRLARPGPGQHPEWVPSLAPPGHPSLIRHPPTTWSLGYPASTVSLQTCLAMFCTGYWWCHESWRCVPPLIISVTSSPGQMFLIGLVSDSWQELSLPPESWCLQMCDSSCLILRSDTWHNECIAPWHCVGMAVLSELCLMEMCNDNNNTCSDQFSRALGN